MDSKAGPFQGELVGSADSKIRQRPSSSVGGGDVRQRAASRQTGGSPRHGKEIALGLFGGMSLRESAPVTTQEKVVDQLIRARWGLVQIAVVSIAFAIMAILGVFPSWKAGYALWVVLTLVILLSHGIFTSAALCFLFILLLFLLPNVVPVSTLTSGFGNKLVFSIGLLYVVAKGARESTLVNYFVKHILGKPKDVRGALIRLCPATMLLSGFINNTAIVAILMPVVQQWATENHMDPKQLLMPLSISAIYGGMLTAIGTSANLVAISLFATEEKLSNGWGSNEFDNFGFFEVGYVGLPCCILAFIYMYILTPYLLGGDRAKGTNDGQNPESNEMGGLGTDEKRSQPQYAGGESEVNVLDRFRAYTVMMRVKTVSSDTSTPVSEGYCGIKDARIIAVRRAEETKVRLLEVDDTEDAEQPVAAGDSDDQSQDISRDFVAVDVLQPGREREIAGLSGFGTMAPEDVPLQPGDVLTFAGSVNSITNEVFTLENLEPIEAHQARKLTASYNKRRLVVAVVATHSRLVGLAVRNVKFRQRYFAAIIGVHRQGESTEGSIADVVLQAGDGLLLEASTEFMDRHSDSPDFVSVTQVAGDIVSVLPKDRPYQALLVGTVIILIAALSGSQLLDLSTVLLLAVFVMLFGRTISQEQGMAAVNGYTLVVVASGFGISRALVETGASRLVASSMNVLFGSHSYFGLLLSIFLVTAALSNVIVPAAVVTIMFPVVFAVQAVRTGTNDHSRKALGVLLISASSCIASPYSYAANLMVSQTAGYTFRDYIIFGGPLIVFTMLLTCILAEFSNVWVDDD